MEERVVETQIAYPHTRVALPSSVEAEMADGTWFAKQQLMKPVQLTQFQWLTTQTRNTILSQIQFPDVLQNVESLMMRTLSMYAFFKMSPIFRVQINSTQFHQGQLICFWTPFNKQTPDDIHSATGYPHVKILASESDAVELVLPYISPRSFLTTNFSVNQQLGTFNVSVLNPLLVADGTTPAVTVTIWLYASDASVHVPIQYHEPILSATSLKEKDPKSSKSRSPVIAEMFDNIQDKLPNEVKSVIPKSFSSRIIEDTKSVVKTLGNIVTGNFGQSESGGVGALLSGFAGSMDYPSDTIMPDKTISPIENLSLAVGKSRSQRMALNAFSVNNLPDDVASESLNSMNFKDIVTIPMLLNQVSFTSTQTAQSILFSLPVHPNVVAQIDNDRKQTYLSYVSNAFLYWTGGITYDIEVVATRFHSGKLLFAFVPNTQTIPTYIDASTSLPNVVIDIQQSANTSFIVPFNSPTSMKSTYNPQSALPSQYLDTFNGTLVCYIQNTLTCASNVSPSVEINIYHSASSDFNLYIPRRPTQLINPPPTSLSATSGISIIGSQNHKSQTSAVLSKDQSMSIARPHFGETYPMIDLLRRFSSFDRLTISTIPTQDPPSNIGYDTINVTPFETGTILSSYLYYFSQIYCAFNGSLRYKLVTSESRTSTSSLQVTHIPDLSLVEPALAIDDYYFSVGYANVRTNLAQDNSLEIEIPYYSKFNMLLDSAIIIGDPYSSSNGSLIVSLQDSSSSVTPTTVPVDVFIAVGEDFRFIYLVPPPHDRALLVSVDTIPY